MRTSVVRLRGAARLLLASAVIVVTGCGAEVEVSSGPDKPDRPETLAGATLASRANTQLEKENADLVHGDLTCADVKFEVGATSRCLRTVVLDDGRLVRIGATATIDETKGGGHFQIKVDDTPQEFGIVGKAVFDDLGKQYAARYKTKKPQGSCPAYLPGRKGARITCTLVTEDGRLRVQVRVTGVDPANFNTTYTYKAVN
ncbi:MAG: DUF4333 domain-containing protein [Marmoricola sp.]